MVMLCDGQRGVENHPMDQVGHLAHTAAYTTGGGAAGDGQAFPEATAGGGIAHQMPSTPICGTDESV